MIRRVVLAASLSLAMSACSEAPAGEPVVRINLDGSVDEVVPLPSPVPTPSQATEPSACRDITFEGAALTHCTADPTRHRIAMANAPTGGQPFGSLTAFASTVDTASIAFAMNGGMYGDDLKPVGYYVENGDRLSEIDRGTGEGNFYMQPNGVFFGTGGTWRVLARDAFIATVGDRPQFGTQSGPMLVIDGKLHPAIQDNGPSRTIRNGVGVDAKGLAHFVISHGDISFGQLARYFRDEVKAANALCLDGKVSALWDPATGRQDKARVGPIIVVSKREGAAQ